MPDLRPRVLLAARPAACAPFRAAINGDADILEAGTMSEAVARLKSDRAIHLVCSTLFFDESRMFDLLRWVRAERPHIPFVCARALTKDSPRISLEAVRIAAESLGAATFVDLPVLVEGHGEKRAREQLRRLLFSQLTSS